MMKYPRFESNNNYTGDPGFESNNNIVLQLFNAMYCSNASEKKSNIKKNTDLLIDFK